MSVINHLQQTLFNKFSFMLNGTKSDLRAPSNQAQRLFETSEYEGIYQKITLSTSSGASDNDAICKRNSKFIKIIIDNSTLFESPIDKFKDNIEFIIKNYIIKVADGELTDDNKIIARSFFTDAISILMDKYEFKDGYDYVEFFLKKAKENYFSEDDLKEIIEEYLTKLENDLNSPSQLPQAERLREPKRSNQKKLTILFLKYLSEDMILQKKLLPLIFKLYEIDDYYFKIAIKKISSPTIITSILNSSDSSTKEACLRKLIDLPGPIESISKKDKKILVSIIYDHHDQIIKFRDICENNALHYAYSSNNLDAVILLTAIFSFTPSKNKEGKLPIALYNVDDETKKRKIRELLSISSSEKNIYKKFINTLLLLESDDVKKTLLAKFIRESTILNREFERHEFEAYFSELLENDSDDKFKECLLNILPSSDLFVIYQKISGSNNTNTKGFSLEVLKKIFNQDNNKIKKILLPFSLAFDDKDHLDFIYEYIIANPSSSKNLVQDEDYENGQTIAELFINSSLSHEQKSSLVKTILTDENFDESTKNKFFSALLKNQEFLKSFIDEDSVQKLLLAWNFDNLDEGNLSLALKQISAVQEEKRNEHTKLLLSKILKSFLTSTKIAVDVRIKSIFSMLYKGKKIPLDLIHEYFMDNKLNSIEGLMDKDIIGKFGKLIVNSKFNYEKKSSLIKKFFSEKNSVDESFDVEVKKNIFISLFENEEFASRFLKENFYYFAIYARYLPKEYQRKIRIITTGINAETQTPDAETQTQKAIILQNSTPETQTRIATQNKGSQTAEDLREFQPIEASTEEDDGSKSLAEAEIVQAKSLSASPSKPMQTKQVSFKEPSSEDYTYLSKLLSGTTTNGSTRVQSYNPDLETITTELKQFNVYFTKHNTFGNEGLTTVHKLADLFHSWFNPLLDKISNTDFRGDKEELKTYLYAILCISIGESESIVKFYNYYDYFINKNLTADVRFGTGHGSWISTPEQYSKLKVIIRKLDELAGKNPDIFTKENLNAYLKCQIQDRRLKNFRFLKNEEFIISLIKSFKVKPLDPKAKELTDTRIDLQDFLKPNAIFLENLVKIADQSDHENNKLANYLFDFLIAKITPSANEEDQHTVLVNTDKLEKIEELKEDFNEKITEFIKQINSNIKPDFLDDPHHKLIFELILEIPIDLQDFLKPKLNQDLAGQGVEIRATAVSKKITNFIKSLESQDPNDQRKSIVEFREICLEQSQIYSQKAQELRELGSSAKTSSASASR